MNTLALFLAAALVGDMTGRALVWLDFLRFQRVHSR
jgi:hypothetical protein